MDTNTQQELPAENKKVEEKPLPNLPKFDKEELLRIFDEIIFSGEYTEPVTIKNKLKITFRARTAGDTTAISREIDSNNWVLMSTLQEQRALLNLAYSLVEYSGRDLSKMKIEDRKEMLNKLPAVIVAALSNELSKFDTKIDAACQEGEANF